MPRNAETARNFYERYNRRDYDGCLQLMAPDATYTEVPFAQEGHGHAEIRAILQDVHRSVSQVRFEVDRVIDAGDTCVVECTATGRNDGPFGPYLATNRDLELSFCDVVRFDGEGRITAVRSYWDLHTVLVQLGHTVPFELEPSQAPTGTRPRPPEARAK